MRPQWWFVLGIAALLAAAGVVRVTSSAGSSPQLQNVWCKAIQPGAQYESKSAGGRSCG